MEYTRLKEPCKTMIAKGYCLGCNKLEFNSFTSDSDCKIYKDFINKGEQIKLWKN